MSDLNSSVVLLVVRASALSDSNVCTAHVALKANQLDNCQSRRVTVHTDTENLMLSLVQEITTVSPALQ
jgi:hypothetical protein